MCNTYVFGSPRANQLSNGVVAAKNESWEDVGYRFGFNGKEKDSQLKGEGNTIATEARLLDTRLGCWLSIDPLYAKYPFASPYTVCNNNPVLFVDPTGEGGKITIDEAQKKITIETTIYLYTATDVQNLRMTVGETRVYNKTTTSADGQGFARPGGLDKDLTINKVEYIVTVKRVDYSKALSIKASRPDDATINFFEILQMDDRLAGGRAAILPNGQGCNYGVVDLDMFTPNSLTTEGMLEDIFCEEAWHTMAGRHYLLGESTHSSYTCDNSLTTASGGRCNTSVCDGLAQSDGGSKVHTTDIDAVFRAYTARTGHSVKDSSKVPVSIIAGTSAPKLAEPGSIPPSTSTHDY